MSIFGKLFRGAAPVVLPPLAEYLGRTLGLPAPVAHLWAEATESLARGESAEVVAEKAMKAALRKAAMRAILP